MKFLCKNRRLTMKGVGKNLMEILSILKQHKEELRQKYHIRKLKIFGSYAEGRETPASDLDIIVEFDTVPTFIELVKIEQILSTLLGVKVDLLTEEGISPFIRPHIRTIEVFE